MIGATVDNAAGIAGMNKDVTLLPCKFLDASGGGYLSDAIACLNWCVQQGAQISSNSWGGGGYTQAMYDAISAARSAGHLFIAAAGNDGANADSSPMYPAAYDLDNIISVAAISSSNSLASFSNYGSSSVDIGAPGVSIYSTLKTGYGDLSGTSMAAPHVSGAAAVLKGAYPSATYRELRDAILSGARPTTSLSGRTSSGGRLDVGAALEILVGTSPEPSPSPVPEPSPSPVPEPSPSPVPEPSPSPVPEPSPSPGGKKPGNGDKERPDKGKPGGGKWGGKGEENPPGNVPDWNENPHNPGGDHGRPDTPGGKDPRPAPSEPVPSQPAPTVPQPVPSEPAPTVPQPVPSEPAPTVPQPVPSQPATGSGNRPNGGNGQGGNGGGRPGGNGGGRPGGNGGGRPNWG